MKRHNLSKGLETVVFRVQTLPFTMHYGGEKLGKEWSDFDPPKLYLTLSAPDYSENCEVSSKWSENCDGRRGDRQTDRHTDRRE